MGICESALSNDEKQLLRQQIKMNKQLDEKLKVQDEKEQKVLKLLLLGPGSSGKSTLFKQMIKIYGRGFDEADRRLYTQLIFQNVLDSMRLLLKYVHKYGGELNPELRDAAKIVQESKEGGASEGKMKDAFISEDHLAPQIKALWSDPAIQKTYDAGAAFHLNESCKYFFDKLDDIAAFGYVPSESDILRVRAPTTGIIETEFVIDGNVFKMLDVGGQRSERRKWIHCFENVTAVLFVAAISEYNQVLFEDETTNRVVESLTLFDEVCNSKWFKKTHMILFLNKRDLFAEKIERVPFNKYFPEYPGPNTYEELVFWIENEFATRNRVEDKKVYTHVTCATDTNNVKAVFYAVKNIIIRRNLEKFGLL